MLDSNAEEENGGGGPCRSPPRPRPAAGPLPRLVSPPIGGPVRSARRARPLRQGTEEGLLQRNAVRACAAPRPRRLRAPSPASRLRRSIAPGSRAAGQRRTYISNRPSARVRGVEATSYRCQGRGRGGGCGGTSQSAVDAGTADPGVSFSGRCLSDLYGDFVSGITRPDTSVLCASRGSVSRLPAHATCCSQDVCTAMEDATPILERQIDDQDDTDTQGTTEHPIQENKPKRKPNITKSQGRKGKKGESCLRTFDCGPELCCARHFWTKICKPVPLEGQVCSRRGHKATAQAPGIFQRCDCGPGLSCRSQATGRQQHSRLRVCQKNLNGCTSASRSRRQEPKTLPIQITLKIKSCSK
ncbi:dickkopf-related protein 4 [Kogia breviceps]|uniref:dickkopf-related protein 4 n=1 Tax=Kogia breviceps TaxID=27615 RepID=UPI0034D2A7D8